jgi:membrane protein DedA with SNARE-associated domain/membrane-associated phospholipid phosphatase
VKPGPLISAAVLLGYLLLQWRRGRLERMTLIGAGVVIAGLVVYGVGLIHPPNVEHLLVQVGERLGKWTYLLVGAMAFLETGAFVGLVAPGESAILVGGVVAGQGKIDVVTLIAIVWVCAVAGDLTSFTLGRRLGRSFMVRHGARVQITEERLETVERFFDRHGGKAILLGRFVGLVRAIAPFLAGSSRMPLRRFAPYDIIGAGLWGTTFVLLGYIFWQSLGAVLDAAKKGALAFGAAIVLAVAVVNVVRWVRVPENRARARAWIETQAQRPALRPLARVLAPVIRTSERPARFVWDRVTPGDLGLELTTLLAIVVVGGFVFGAYAVTLDDIRFTAGDLRALRIADQLRTDWLVEAAKAVTRLGDIGIVGLVVVFTSSFLIARRRALEGAALLSGLFLTHVGVQVAKGAIDRPRPGHPLVDISGYSYPSGHAADAIAWIAVAVALRHALPGIATRAAVVTVAIVIAVAVALSRVYLRAHFLSDVLGGAGLGAAIFASCGMVALFVSYIRNNHRSSG